MDSDVLNGERWRVDEGDCLPWLAGLPDGCADLLFADPPYGIGKAEWDHEFSLTWLPEAARCCGRFMLVTPGTGNVLRMPEAVGALSYRWTVYGYITNGMTFGGVGFQNVIPALVYCRDGVSSNIGARDCHAFPISGDKPDHPSPKPLAFIDYIVRHFSRVGALVVDPFTGSGTTGVAAIANERRFIGCELNPDYAAMARERIGWAARGLKPPKPAPEPDAYQQTLFAEAAV